MGSFEIAYDIVLPISVHKYVHESKTVRERVLGAKIPAIVYVTNCAINALIATILFKGSDSDPVDKKDSVINNSIYYVDYERENSPGHAFAYIVVDNRIVLIEASQYDHHLKIKEIKLEELLSKLIGSVNESNGTFRTYRFDLASPVKIMDNAIEFAKSIEKKDEYMELETEVRKAAKLAKEIM